MRNYLNIFASFFLLSSTVVCGIVFTRIFTHAEDHNSPQLAQVLSETTIQNNSEGLDSASVPVAQGITQISSSKSWLENVFSWKEEPYKLSTHPEIYFNEDARFYKNITVDGDALFSNAMSIGGLFSVDNDATFDEKVTFKSERLKINGIEYLWPDEEVSGALTSDGEGNLTWSALSSGVSNFLGLSDTPNSYSGSGSYLLRVNGGANALEFVDSALFGGGINSIENSDGTLTISPTIGEVVASLNLNNENTWLAEQSFSGGLSFSGSSGFDSSGNLGLGTTDPTSLLTMVGGNFTQTASGDVSLEGSLFSSNNGRGIHVSGRYAYMAVNAAGVMIYDIYNPSSPTLVSTFDTPGGALGVKVVGRYMYVADATSGLLIVDVSDPSNPVQVGQYDTGNQSYGLYVSGSYAYMADFNDGLVIVDISNVYNPALVGSYNTSGSAISVYVTGNYAYVADNTSGLQIINISDPANPTSVGSYNTPSNANDVYVTGNYAYIADNSAGLHIVDVSDPANPTLAATYNTDSFSGGVHVSGRYAYVADWDKLEIIDVSVPTSPVYVGEYDSAYIINKVFVAGKYAYITANGLQIIDINGIDTPALAAGNISASDISIGENAYINNDVHIGNGLLVGTGGANFSGKVGIGESSAFSALRVNQLGSGNIFDLFDGNTNVLSVLDGGFVGIGTTGPSYKLDVDGIGRTTSFLTESLVLGSSYSSMLTSFKGFSGFTNFNGGIGTGGRDSQFAYQRITNSGNLKNIGSIQAGETLLTSGGTFTTKVDYTAGSDARGVAMGDLNGDGWNDIAIAHSSGGEVSVLINDGDGTFATAVDYATGSGAHSVTVADFNGDGWLDLASSNSSVDNVSVLINDGDGTFATAVDYSVGDQPYWLDSGDINNDGKQDLIVGNFTDGDASVLVNNGDGTFATAVDYATANSPYSIAIGDFNGDGWGDFVSANYNSASISVFINDGDGTFAAKADYSTTNVDPISVATADFNGDGVDDVVAAHSQNASMSVFINDGDGTFAAAVGYATGANAREVSVGDVNGDGYIDIATPNGIDSDVSVFINDGDGTFAAKVDYPTTTFPWGIEIGDVNNDGKQDLAVAGFSTTSVLMNQLNPLFYAQASTGRVGIGTTAPTSLLDIDGLGTGSGTALVIDADGNVYRDSSSERYKMNIEPLAAEFEKVLQLEPKTYEFKDSGILSIGYIAEEVEQLGGLSDLLIFDNEGNVDGFKYDRLPIYTLEIVKDLNERVKALEERLAMNPEEPESYGISSESDYFGIITVDDDGDVTIENNMRVDGLLTVGKLNVDDRTESLGVVKIVAGETSAEVESPVLSHDSLIFVTADQPVPVSAKNSGEGYFTIEIGQELEEDININWLIIN